MPDDHRILVRNQRLLVPQMAAALRVQTSGADPCCNTFICCFPDGHCEVLECQICQQQGGECGLATKCTEGACVGACCKDGSCTEKSRAQCLESGGVFSGLGTRCETEYPPGACCLPNHSCQMLDECACNAAGGSWKGADSTCDPNPCDDGACCVPPDQCLEVSEAQCAAANGTWKGAGTSCAIDPCWPRKCCKGTPPCTCSMETNLECFQNSGWAMLEGDCSGPAPCCGCGICTAAGYPSPMYFTVGIVGGQGSCCLSGEYNVIDANASCRAEVGWPACGYVPVDLLHIVGTVTTYEFPNCTGAVLNNNIKRVPADPARITTADKCVNGWVDPTDHYAWCGIIYHHYYIPHNGLHQGGGRILRRPPGLLLPNGLPARGRIVVPGGMPAAGRGKCGGCDPHQAAARQAWMPPRKK